MNKNEFLLKLEKELKKRNILNIDEIIEDYNDHFEHKLSNGYSEEEICIKLGSIEEIACSYAPKVPEQKDAFKKVCTITGLVFIDVAFAMFYVLLCATVVTIGAFALTSLVTGFCLITTINIANLIPTMPYLSSFALGITLFALSVFVATGTIYSFLITKQCAKKYFRWHSNIKNDNARPSLSIMPALQIKTRRILSRLCMLSFIIFSVLFIIALFISFAQANFAPFWHKWNWFK